MRPIARAMSIADEQLGVATRRQLLAAGLSDHQIRQLLGTGALLDVFSGVYRTAGATASFEQRCFAAVLACGEGAVASHMAAAALRRLVPEPDHIEVTIGRKRRAERPGVVVHQSGVLEACDTSTYGLVPVTSPERTLLDIAPSLDDTRFEVVTDDAFRRLVSPKRLLVYLDRPELANRNGIGRLRRFARDRLMGGVPESVLETTALALITEHRLPAPDRQFTTYVAGRAVRFDLAYPEERVAIELDGRGPHWGRERWQSDHDRHNAVELGEWRVLRFTYEDVTERPAYVVQTIAAKLGLRPRGWARKKSRKRG